ncbi:MAG: alpha/beta hydrolase [Pseudomonadota bacterium]
MSGRAVLSIATEDLELPNLRNSIRYFRKGQGPSILCVHATGHGCGDFAPLADELSDHYDFTALDWPGHGASDTDREAPDAALYADIIIEAIETLGLNRPILLGNSIGGAAAIIAAHKRPDLISALLLCNPGGLAKVDFAARMLTGGMARIFAAGARGASWFGPLFSFYYKRMILPGAPDRAQQIISVGQEIAPLLSQAWRGFGQQDADIRALAPQIDLPVWLAWARQDRFVSWGRSKAAALTFPRHSVTFYKGGHAPFLEELDMFSRDFRAFADQVAGR